MTYLAQPVKMGLIERLLFFSAVGFLHAAIWTTSSLLLFGGFNQT